MDSDLEAVGTNAHELPMVAAALAKTDEELGKAPYKVLRDWNRLYGDLRPRRVNLPTYPFAKERCWFDGTTSVPAQDNEIASAADIRSIEEIMKQIDDDAMETDDAVQALRTLL